MQDSLESRIALLQRCIDDYEKLYQLDRLARDLTFGPELNRLLAHKPETFESPASAGQLFSFSRSLRYR